MPKRKFKTDRGSRSTTSGRDCYMEKLQEIQKLWEIDKNSDHLRQCHSQLLTFLSRTQKETESASAYLTNLQDLAMDAEIGNKRQVVCQFMTGCKNVALRETLLSMKDLPTLAELRKLCDEAGSTNSLNNYRCIVNGFEIPAENNAFDMLFDKNVMHILEEIFLSLDYKTLKNC